MVKRKTAKKADISKTKTLKRVSNTSLKNNLFSKSNNLVNKLNKLKEKKYFPSLLIIFLLITLAYFGRSLLFAAMVDGKPISRIRLINELEKQAGQEALDSLITKKLISGAAKDKGINVSDSQVNLEIDRISQMLEQQGTTIEAALSMQGQDMNDLIENIRLQKTVEGLVAENLVVTEDELLNYFEINKAYYGEDVKYEDIKSSIQDQLVQEKLSSEFQILIQKLKAEGNIIYFVDFN